MPAHFLYSWLFPLVFSPGFSRANQEIGEEEKKNASVLTRELIARRFTSGACVAIIRPAFLPATLSASHDLFTRTFSRKREPSNYGMRKNYRGTRATVPEVCFARRRQGRRFLRACRATFRRSFASPLREFRSFDTELSRFAVRTFEMYFEWGTLVIEVWELISVKYAREIFFPYTRGKIFLLEYTPNFLHSILFFLGTWEVILLQNAYRCWSANRAYSYVHVSICFYFKFIYQVNLFAE